jgi:O-antigen/teichoic acid export membrane protein
MLIRNSLLYIASKVAPGLLGMATTGILTRLLAPESYGRYGLALVIMSFGGATMFDWLGLSFLRFYQARRDDPRVISTFIQLFALVVLLTLAIVPAAWALGAFSGADAPIYAVGVFMMWCFAWFEFVAKMEVAKIRPFKFLIMNLGRAGFMFAGAVSAAWLTRDPIYTALGVGAGILCGATIGGFGGWSLRAGAFDRKLAVAVAAFGLPIAASMVLSSLVTSGTRALLGAIDGAEALGLYTAGFMLIQNTLTVASSGIAAAG